MDCQTTQELLPELLQGKLDRETEQRALAHLAACADCRQELAFWASLAQAVRQEAHPLPESVFEDVADRLGLRAQPTLWETLQTVGGALRMTGSAVRLALALAQNP